MASPLAHRHHATMCSSRAQSDCRSGTGNRRTGRFLEVAISAHYLRTVKEFPSWAGSGTARVFGCGAALILRKLPRGASKSW